MKDLQERITYLLGTSGVHGAQEIYSVFKDAENNAWERGQGDFYPVNVCYEITSAAIGEIAPDMLQTALENEASDARNSGGLYGLGSKIAEKLLFRELDGYNAWHDGVHQVIARRVAEACAALGLEIDEDDIDAASGVADAIQNAADQLEEDEDE